MPSARDEDAESDEIDPEGPDESEMDFSDDPDLEVCPHCRKLISEETSRCPHCGEYISPADMPMHKGALIVIAIIAAIAVALLIWRST